MTPCVRTIMLGSGILLAGERLARESAWPRPFRVLRPPVIAPQAEPSLHWGDCIVAVARQRDRERFRELFDHFAPRLKSFFLRLGVAPGVAEELAQETLLAVWNKAGQYDPSRAPAATWIFAIARNLRIDMSRRERDPGGFAEVFAGSAEPQPSEQLLTAEAEARVRTAIASLSDEQATVIRLSFFDDRAHGDIARLLGIPLGTVKSRIRLAMNRLRALVEGEQ
jgi:RNA polymerase sigma-70 factor (ECF subfamily)